MYNTVECRPKEAVYYKRRKLKSQSFFKMLLCSVHHCNAVFQLQKTQKAGIYIHCIKQLFDDGRFLFLHKVNICRLKN